VFYNEAHQNILQANTRVFTTLEILLLILTVSSELKKKLGKLQNQVVIGT
jgi:hypothetical protein